MISIKENMDFKDTEYNQINQIYDECLNYLKSVKNDFQNMISFRKDTNIDFVKEIPEYASLQELNEINYKIEDELSKSYDTLKNPKRFIEQINNDKHHKFIRKEDYYGDTIDHTETHQDNDDKIKRDPKVTQNDKTKELEVQNTPASSIQNSTNSVNEIRSERLRKLSKQLPRIIITQSSTSLNQNKIDRSEFKNYSVDVLMKEDAKEGRSPVKPLKTSRPIRQKIGYGDYPKRLVSKSGIENVALISNVPFEKIRLLNDTFHTLINLRWRWIVSGTIVVHFAIWLVFAVFWYITALAHYDFEPNPPNKTCVTGGKDFVTIFLASVEAQTTIGFGDRTIDEECPESIFLFITQLILGTGLSGVLTCVVYAKLTRPEKLSRDGVGFSKKAVISLRDGKLCLMIRAWDLNHDHIISSEFTAHFVKTYRTKEGETIRYFARSLKLQQREFLLWPVTLVHVIDSTSPFYEMGPADFADFSYEITISLKGASASMGTFTQSQTSYLPREILWGYRFPSVVRYDHRKQKYVINHKKLDDIELFDTPLCSAWCLDHAIQEKCESAPPGTPSCFSERISTFHLGRSSSFRRKIETKV